MRRELIRQIAELEGTMSRLVVDNAPYRPAQTSPIRGPAILSTAELEQVRDELLTKLAKLHGQVLQRVEWELDEPRVRTGWLRLRRRRSSPGK
jgi:hypothetical protein